MKKFHFSHR